MTAKGHVLQAPSDIPLQRIVDRHLNDAGVELAVLRLDLINPYISGNKWFKLKYNLENMLEQEGRCALSFGGAFSNHIHALAWAGHELGIETVGVIRGEAEYASNPTLSDAVKWGMRLMFVDRKTYRQKNEPDFLLSLQKSFGEYYLIPEGGSNALAVKGCTEIVPDEVKASFGPTHLVTACGTGGTLAGLAVSNPELEVIGIPVLKNAGFLNKDIEQLISTADYTDPNNWQLDLLGHCGGYAKQSPELTSFCNMFTATHDIPLEYVYTGKMMLRLWQLIEEGYFAQGSRVLAIHTGGIQGMRGLAKG